MPTVMERMLGRVKERAAEEPEETVQIDFGKDLAELEAEAGQVEETLLDTEPFMAIINALSIAAVRPFPFPVGKGLGGEEVKDEVLSQWVKLDSSEILAEDAGWQEWLKLSHKPFKRMARKGKKYAKANQRRPAGVGMGRVAGEVTDPKEREEIKKAYRGNGGTLSFEGIERDKRFNLRWASGKNAWKIIKVE